MEPNFKNRFLILNLILSSVLILLSAETPAFAESDIVSPSDAQHFEQTYEDWARSLIKRLNPKLEFTILSQIEFSRNPGKLQEYEDIKAANHLPGLPDIADPNYTNPLESPLYALVAKKNFKLIYYTPLNSQEMGLFKEVLVTKLRLGEKDQLIFEYVNRKAPVNPKSDGNFRIQLGYFCLFLGFLSLVTALFYRKKSTLLAQVKDMSTVKIETKEPAPLEIPLTNNSLLAINQIENATPGDLRKILASEKSELIARASLNASKKLSNRLLGECEQSKFDLVIQWIQKNHKMVSHQDSNYARLLLAARLQQAQNEQVLSSIDAFNKAHEMRAKLKASRSFKITPIPEVNEASL